jgi:hypothetical protein
LPGGASYGSFDMPPSDLPAWSKVF